MSESNSSEGVQAFFGCLVIGFMGLIFFLFINSVNTERIKEAEESVARDIVVRTKIDSPHGVNAEGEPLPSSSATSKKGDQGRPGGLYIEFCRMPKVESIYKTYTRHDATDCWIYGVSQDDYDLLREGQVVKFDKGRPIPRR